MGRVFTPEQISDNKLPKRGAHEAAGRYIIDALGDETAGSITGAMIYGSTTTGPNRRSDVDVLVTLSPYDYDNRMLLAARDVMASAEAQFNVPVEAQVVSTIDIARPLQHGIDPLFAIELSKAADKKRWVRGNPLGNLGIYDLSDTALRAIGVQYSAAKMKKFTKAILEGRGDVDYHVLQRALELPAALGRKVLPATDRFDAEGDYSVNDKPNMVAVTGSRLRRLQNVLADISYTGALSDNPASLFEQLHERDNEYNYVLRDTIHGAMTVGEYEEWIQDTYVDTLQLARQVSRDASELVRLSGRVENPESIDWEAPVYTDEQAPEEEEFLPYDDDSY